MMQMILIFLKQKIMYSNGS